MSMMNTDDTDKTDDNQGVTKAGLPIDVGYQSELADALRQIKNEGDSPHDDLKVGPHKGLQAAEQIISIPKTGRPPFSVGNPIADKTSQNIFLNQISKVALPTGERVSLSHTKSNAYKMTTLYNIHPNEHKFLLDS